MECFGFLTGIGLGMELEVVGLDMELEVGGPDMELEVGVHVGHGCFGWLLGC